MQAILSILTSRIGLVRTQRLTLEIDGDIAAVSGEIESFHLRQIVIHAIMQAKMTVVDNLIVKEKLYES